MGKYGLWYWAKERWAVVGLQIENNMQNPKRGKQCLNASRASQGSCANLQIRVKLENYGDNM